jgi:hypothetical protein
MPAKQSPNTQNVSALYETAPALLTNEEYAAIRLDQLGRVRVVPEVPIGGATPTQVEGITANNIPTAENAVLVGGIDIGGNKRALAVDTTGKLQIQAILDSDIQLTVSDRISVFFNTLPDGSGVPTSPVVDLNGFVQVVVQEERCAVPNGLPLPPEVKVVAGWDGFGVHALKTKPDGTLLVDPGPIVIVPGPAVGSPLTAYNSVGLVAVNVETTVVSYIVPPGMTLHLVGATGTGNIGNARFTLYINGVLQMGQRISVASPDAIFNFRDAEPLVFPAQIVALKVTHFMPGPAGTFEGTILGVLT